MSRFMQARYSELTAYTPGEQPQDRKYIKLNTNESPFPPSEGVFRAITEAEILNLNLYPDPECRVLRSEIASYCSSFCGRDIKPENIFVSNGSDDILSFYFMAFAGANGGVLFPDITYGFYKVYSELYGAEYTEIPLNADLTVSAADYISTHKNTVIANPNAPTGLCISVSDIEDICASNPDNTVLIDEAYVDFGADSCMYLTEKYKNLITAMTYSKSRSMAGARLGFAVADKELIDDLNKIKYSTNPYSIDRLTAIAGAAAMKDSAYYVSNCRRIAATRERIKKELISDGFELTDSKSNFIFVKCPGVSGEDIYRALKERGILVRHFTKDRIKDYVRITVGTDGQMDALTEALHDIRLGAE